jgi:hypothetical protein
MALQTYQSRNLGMQYMVGFYKLLVQVQTLRWDESEENCTEVQPISISIVLARGVHCLTLLYFINWYIAVIFPVNWMQLSSLTRLVDQRGSREQPMVVVCSCLWAVITSVS